MIIRNYEYQPPIKASEQTKSDIIALLILLLALIIFAAPILMDNADFGVK